jgi:hypothetical protein
VVLPEFRLVHFALRVGIQLKKLSHLTINVNEWIVIPRVGNGSVPQKPGNPLEKKLKHNYTDDHHRAKEVRA